MGITDRVCFALAVAVYGGSCLYSVFLWRRGFRQDDRVNYLLLFFAFSWHTMAMAKRGFSLNRCPVTNLYEAIAFLLWVMAAAYLVVGLWHRFRFVGAFVSPVLFAVGVFALFPDLDKHGSQPDFTTGWSSLHASLILLAYGSFGLASVAGVMFLTQERDLKRHRARGVLSLLPSMARLEVTTGRLLVVGLGLLTVGLLLGGHNLRTRGMAYTVWDSKILWSAFVWLLYLGLLILRFAYAHRGRRLAWGAVGSFVFVLLTFWGTNLMSAIHHQP